MPTNLGRPYATEWRGSPPQMLQSDVPVWYRFLEKWGLLFQKLYYDVTLGGPILTEQQKADTYWRMFAKNISKRADAIAELENAVWIIEVAKTPGLRAVGQLLVYRALWIEDPKITKPEEMVLVVQDLDTDLLASAAMYGIRSYVMPLPAP